MPAGESSVVVGLTVKRDMWVRFVVAEAVDGQPIEEPNYWSLCLPHASPGRHENVTLRWFAFLAEGDQLRVGNPAYAIPRVYPRDSLSSCFWPMDGTTVPQVVVPEPIDAVLLLVVSTQDPDGQQLAPFKLQLGIATHRCPNGVVGYANVYCGPEQLAAGEPLARGPAAHTLKWSQTDPCDDCGFTVEDDRAGGAGTVAFDRIGQAGGVSAFWSVLSPAEPPELGIDDTVSMQLGTTAAGCRIGPGMSAWATAVTTDASPALHAVWTTAGSTQFSLTAQEWPVDLGLLGYTMSPTLDARGSHYDLARPHLPTSYCLPE